MQPSINTTDQFLVHQPLADKSSRDELHLPDRIQLPKGMPPGKSTYITTQMFLAHLVVRALMGPRLSIDQKLSMPLI